jgi:hypothetical protein
MITTFKSSFIGKKVHFQVNPKASDNSTTFSATHQANALYRAELLNQDATIAATLLAGYNDASLVRGTLAATGGTPFASLHNTSAEQLLEYINNHQSARGTYAGRCFLAGHSCQVTDDYQFANQGIPVQNIVLQFEAHRALPPVKDIRKWGYIESPMRAGQGNDNQLHVWLMHDTMFVVGLDGGCSLLK